MIIMTVSLQMEAFESHVVIHTVIPQNSSYQFTNYPFLEIRKFVTGFQTASQFLLIGNPSSRKQTVLPAVIHGCCCFPYLECALPSSIPNLSLQMRLKICRWSFDNTHDVDDFPYAFNDVTIVYALQLCITICWLMNET